jgi:hypothetical protein
MRHFKPDLSTLALSTGNGKRESDCVSAGWLQAKRALDEGVPGKPSLALLVDVRLRSRCYCTRLRNR